jgi:hypothetical protein
LTPLREEPRSWWPVIGVAFGATLLLGAIGAFSRFAMYAVSGVLFVVLGTIFSVLVAKEIRRGR